MGPRRDALRRDSLCSANAGLFPTYAVQAARVRMTFEDLVHLFRKQLNG